MQATGREGIAREPKMNWPISSDAEFMRGLDDHAHPIGEIDSYAAWARLERLSNAGFIRLVRARASSELRYVVLTGAGLRCLREYAGPLPERAKPQPGRPLGPSLALRDFGTLDHHQGAGPDCTA